MGQSPRAHVPHVRCIDDAPDIRAMAQVALAQQVRQLWEQAHD